jgi:hypothetical protein
MTTMKSFRDGVVAVSAEAGGQVWLGGDLAARSEYVTAFHESGHVVSGTSCGLSIDRATIDPKVAGPERAGCVWLIPDDHCKFLKEFSDAPLFELVRPCADDFTAEERRSAARLVVRLYARTVTLLAGTQAELLFYPDREPRIATTDVREAERFAVLVAGSSSASLLDDARADAERILASNKHQVEAVAAALLERKTLDAEEIGDVLSLTPAQSSERARKRRWAATVASAAAFGNSLEPLRM